MLAPYERRLVFCLSNAASRLRHHSREAETLADWVAEKGGELAFEDLTAPGDERPKRGVPASEWRRFSVRSDSPDAGPKARKCS